METERQNNGSNQVAPIICIRVVLIVSILT